MEKARFFEAKGSAVKCNLCNRHCIIEEGSVGYCRVRKNINGTLYSLVYGRTLTLSADPIEKKPLYNFMPGTICNSISTYGCNFSCDFCQNHGMSQDFTSALIEKVPVTTPEEIVQDTLERGLSGIAYTYTEPTVFAEYALDTMKLARKNKLYNVWVSNGYMSKKAVAEIAKNIDAINIDLKGSAKFYRKVCGNIDITKVKESIKLFHKKGVHVEVTNLVVPEYNDSKQDFESIASFIASVDKRIPLHFSRFYPHYRMSNWSITPGKKLFEARDIAIKKGLSFVYIGNFQEQQDTFCPACGKKLIERHGYKTQVKGLDGKGNCAFCGAPTGIKQSL